jgi:chromodomain-helicase-DNA-binding protein 4
VLDHLIVQKMDDEESGGENVQSILTFGAQALFDADNNSGDITCESVTLSHHRLILSHWKQDTDNDIDKLIEKTEKEGEQEEPSKEGVLSFSFAKIWEADKDSLVEVEDQDQGDSWAQTLEKIKAEREKLQSQEIALSGRGVRRRAAIAKVVQLCSSMFPLLICIGD